MQDKQVVCADIESDGLLDTITKIWCASYAVLDSDLQVDQSYTETTYEGIAEKFADPNVVLIMHNGWSFDRRAVEEILGIEVKAEIIDTLFISWYLYPKQMRHGLAWWGEELGIAKPEIDDWENLTLEEYVHRCEEDVRIQTALWRHIWKHMKLLYQNEDEIWHAVRHLSFKAKCAAMQEKSRWKLDIPECQRLDLMFGEKYEEARVALEKHMPEVPKYAKRTRPKKPFKGDGTFSAHGTKWVNLVRAHVPALKDAPDSEVVEYDKEIKECVKHVPPNAGASGQMKEWLYSLGWVPETFKYDRNKETNEVRKIPQIKDADKGTLCPAIERMIDDHPQIEFLKEMSVVKHRKTITTAFLNNVDEQGYVQALVQGLTNTLRFKHKVCLNLPSTRKPYGAEIRGLLIARNSKVELCGSDMSSLEDRTKQHFMWPYDPEYVKEMQRPGFDPHLDMGVAAGMITVEETDEYKKLKAKEDKSNADYERFAALDLIRHGGKSTNYAATYGAKGATIARAAKMPEAVGDKLYDAYWRRNWAITAIADNCVVKQSRGMKWLWNPVSRMWLYLKAEKDKFSTLNQSTGAYCFDRWLYHVIERRPQLTAQFHDEGVWGLLRGNREAMTKILKDAISEVNTELKLNRELDCDVDFADSYAGVH